MKSTGLITLEKASRSGIYTGVGFHPGALCTPDINTLTNIDMCRNRRPGYEY